MTSKKSPKIDFTRKIEDFDILQKSLRFWADLGKLIVAKAFEKLPKVQLIAQSGHTAWALPNIVYIFHKMVQNWTKNAQFDFMF